MICAYCHLELRGLATRQVVGGIPYCKAHKEAAERDAEREGDSDALAIIDPFS